jgi:two-component system sensor kinase FixL
LKYGPGQPIEISTRSNDGTAVLTIRDQGIGIAVEHHHRIFDRFMRAASIQKYGGLGLGLYISKEIIQAHRGTIRVESEPGRGSTFTVELPQNV